MKIDKIPHLNIRHSCHLKYPYFLSFENEKNNRNLFDTVT